jgi:hypothetical protein
MSKMKQIINSFQLLEFEDFYYHYFVMQFLHDFLLRQLCELTTHPILLDFVHRHLYHI